MDSKFELELHYVVYSIIKFKINYTVGIPRRGDSVIVHAELILQSSNLIVHVQDYIMSMNICALCVKSIVLDRYNNCNFCTRENYNGLCMI